MRRSAAVLGLTLAACLCAAQAAPRPGTLPPTEIKDLHYGDVLFHYFQDDYFGALIRLRAAQEQGRVSHHAEEAELLLGGLYLSYGQHLEAGAIFERLLARNVSPSVRNRAWFYLGKVWYQRGYWEQAERALREAGSTEGAGRRQVALGRALESERRNLLAQVLIHQQRYEEAIAHLEDPQAQGDWAAYGQYNLGVALVRAGRLPEAAGLLEAVGQLQTSDEELLALRDKANVALAFAWLQAGQGEAAIPALQRVRLEGPESNKALLALGWAESAAENYERALVPWMELRGRNLLDAAVQESYLAIPYAFSRLDANAQAVEYYTAALKSYGEESARIDASIEAIRAGRMLESIVTLHPAGDGPEQGWFWQLKNLPDAPESRYLYHLLAGHEFQEGLKNYRDLGYMQRNLEAWADSLEAFGNMLDTSALAYEQRLPRVNEVLGRDDPDRLQAARMEIEARLNAAERNGDFVALARADEQDMWSRLQELERHGDELDEEARDKLRLMKGVLYWQLDQSFKARLWSARRGVRELDLALRELQKRWLRVEQARAESPRNHAAFSARVEALRPRIAALEQRIAQVKSAQGRYLAAIAIEELQRQKERLANYELQARYALASLYDRSADTEPAP